MKRPTVLITKPLAKSCEDALAQHFNVISLVGVQDPEALMGQHVADIRAIAGGKVPAALMERLPNLEIIANSGVGVDSIDLPTAKAKNIAVTNTPGVLEDSVAELAVGLMLALARSIPQADRHVRDGTWKENMYPLRSELRGRTVGIVGLGRIGKEIATRLSALKMIVAYCGRSEQFDQPYKFYADPIELARDSDWLVVVAPGGKTTEKIISRAVLTALGPEGRLVNVSRGSLVDQQALVEMLETKQIKGAALDVFENEPEVPQSLTVLDHVVLSPHQGSRTLEAREGMGELVVQNLLAHFAGRDLPSRVL